MKLAACAASAVLAWSAFAASPVSSGVVRDARGNPVAGVTVTIPGVGKAVTGVDGAWRIDGVPAGDVLAVAEKSGLFRVRQTIHAEPGKDLRWDATLGARGFIKGRLVDEYDHPLTGPGTDHKARWRVGALRWPEWMRCWSFIDGCAGPRGTPPMNLSEPRFGIVTDAQGRFELPVDRGTLHCLRVGLPGSFGRALLTGPMSDGLADVVVRVPSSRMPHARVRVRLVAPDGKPIEKARVDFLHSDGDIADEAVFDSAAGVWTSRPMPPGSYWAWVYDSTFGWRDFGPFHVADAADVDAGTIRMPPVGRVRFAVTGGEFAVPIRVERIVADSHAWRTYHGWNHVGCEHLEPGTPSTPSAERDLSPGRYRARVGYSNSIEIEEVEVVFDVRSGETTAATIPLRAAPWRAVRFRCPGATPTYVESTLTDADGAVVGRRVGDGDGVSWLRLPPGRFAVAVETSDERRLAGTLDVPDDNPPSGFVVELR
jgi:hypothetical protein